MIKKNKLVVDLSYEITYINKNYERLVIKEADIVKVVESYNKIEESKILSMKLYVQMYILKMEN